jgi:ubiquinone/menaquinone biosynthesis C-methylase UbiE
MWAAGDYAAIGLATMPVAETIVQSADPHAGQRVLDVACGTGNVALVLARRNCDVTAIDLVPSLVEKAKRRSLADGTEIRFLEGDVQALPFPDASFDCVFSVFGAMFAPDQERAAKELTRVCRPGGTVAMANWIADGAIAAFFGAVTRNLPPTAGLEPPLRWGTVRGVRELFGNRARSVRFEQRTLTESFRSVEHALEIFTTRFGPVHCALGALDARGKGELSDDLSELFRERNRANDGTLAMPFEYLEVLVTIA